MNKYCEGIDCDCCKETEPCIYRIANELEKKLQKIKTYAKNTLNMVDYRTYKGNMYVLAQNKQLDEYTRMVCYQMGCFIDYYLHPSSVENIPNGKQIYRKYGQEKYTEIIKYFSIL